MTNYLAQIPQKIWHLLYEAEFDNVDLLASINLIGWGVWVLVFGSFDNSAIYAAIIHVMSGQYWAYTMIGIGFLRILLLNRGHARERITGIAMSTFLWAFFFVGFAQARPVASITYISLFLLVVSIWELFRIVRKWRIRKIVRDQVQTRPDHE